MSYFLSKTYISIRQSAIVSLSLAVGARACAQTKIQAAAVLWAAGATTHRAWAACAAYYVSAACIQLSCVWGI